MQIKHLLILAALTISSTVFAGISSLNDLVCYNQENASVLAEPPTDPGASPPSITRPKK